MDAPWKSRTHTDHFIPLVISGYPSACAAMRAASIEPIEAPFIRHRREMARKRLDQEPSFRYEISGMNSNGHSANLRNGVEAGRIRNASGAVKLSARLHEKDKRLNFYGGTHLARA
jgi:hypothetical protein